MIRETHNEEYAHGHATRSHVVFLTPVSNFMFGGLVVYSLALRF